MFYEPYSNQQKRQNYPQTIATPSGGAGGGTGESATTDFNFDDFTSNSNSESENYTGPTDWTKEWTQNYLNKFQPWLRSYAMQADDSFKKSALDTTQNTDMMRSNLNNNTSGMRSLIEQARTLMPQQYANEMKLYNERNTQPVLNRMSSRGILNSDITGGALSDVLRDTQAKQSDLVKQSDLWAAQQNVDLSKYITEKGFDIDKYLADSEATQEQEKRTNYLTSEMKYADLIPSLLNVLREQHGSSQSSSSEGLMALLKMFYE